MHEDAVKIVLTVCFVLFWFTSKRLNGPFENNAMNSLLSAENLVDNSDILVSNYSKSKNSICFPKKFVFLKNHKAGSTTLRILLKQFSVKHNFKMNLATYNRKLVGGFPGIFKSKFHKNDEPTDVIFDHLKWNWNEIRKTLSKPVNHKKISIVREPFKLFRSSFECFYSHFVGAEFSKKHDKLTKKQFMKVANLECDCAGEPYLSVVGEWSKHIKYADFVERLYESQSTVLRNAPWNFRVDNSQAYDFNFDENDDIQEQMAEQFDLVLVLERLDESLILLKEELCMDWGDIMGYSRVLNSGSYNTSDGNDELGNDLYNGYLAATFLRLDLEVYSVAEEMLEAKIKDYGVERMANDLEILRGGSTSQADVMKIAQVPYFAHLGNIPMEGQRLEQLLNYMKENHGVCK